MVKQSFFRDKWQETHVQQSGQIQQQQHMACQLQANISSTNR